MILDTLDLDPDQFAAGTGWRIEPQGACRGDLCVPLGGGSGFDVRATADRLGMALVAEPAVGIWALGPETLGEHVLSSAEAPELTLSDLAGAPFGLSDLRGQKVAIVSWAPW